MKFLVKKLGSLNCSDKQMLLVSVLTIDIVIRLLVMSENLLIAPSILIMGFILFRIKRIKKDGLKYFGLFASGVLFFLSVLNMDVSFYYLLSLVYPLLLIYAFLLPNPFITLGASLFFMPLFFEQKNEVGFGPFEGHLIGLVVNGLMYSFLVYIIRKLERQNEKLIKNHEDTDALLSLMPEPVFIHDEDEIFYANKEALKLMGLGNEADIIGMHPLKYVLKNYHDIIREKMDSVLHHNEIARDNIFKMVNNEGKMIDIECSSIAFTYKKRPCIITVVNDVTSKNKMTEEILQKSDKLHLVGQMAAGIAHEIRNPLTSIKGFLQLMRTPTEKSNQYIDIMLNEIERINFIVNEFLVLAKPQSAVFKEIDIISLIDDVLKLLSTQSILHNVQIKTEFKMDIAPINCEENQIKQVFINIIKNAIESMPKGGLLQIEVQSHVNNTILIRFSDQGCGIPKNRLKSLGEPFYTTKEKGTGLGLMVCYKIIENHLGRITIESEINKGTIVEISLPLTVKSLLNNAMHPSNSIIS